MPKGNSRWRVDDVVAYDMMREAAVDAFALLGGAVEVDSSRAESAKVELERLRREVLTVGAYDRSAVTALTSRIENLIRQYEGHSS